MRGIRCPQMIATIRHKMDQTLNVINENRSLKGKSSHNIISFAKGTCKHTSRALSTLGTQCGMLAASGYIQVSNPVGLGKRTEWGSSCLVLIVNLTQPRIT